MRQLLACVVALAGCAFQPPEGEAQPAEDEPAPDGPAALVPCSVTGAKLCIELEDAESWPRDASGRDLAVSAARVSREDSEDTLGHAVQLGTDSELHVAESQTLDIRGAITIEMWILGGGLSYGRQTFLLDNDQQYSMSISDSLELRCAIDDVDADANGFSLIGGWHHVACTYDKDQLRVYVDGQLRDCQSSNKEIPIGNSAGTAIGANLAGTTRSDPFLGRLDNIHVYDRRLAGSELCALANQAGCGDTCPSGGGG
ncbi:MAG: LamG domain-containing protein [Kofleriaceae bacterium]